MDPIRVFLCDDDPALREVVRLRLSQDQDLEIVGEAENGQTCVEQIAETRPDVVLLDLAMPVMSGLEAIPRVQEASPGTGIVVFTGVSDMRPSAIELGVDQCLEKGQPLDYVSLTVRRIGLERRMRPV